MKKKRINNDLNIRWELYDKNGNNLDLSNIAIDFKIIHATTRRAFIPIFSTENNIIISQFPAINQLKLGKYYLYCCLRNTDITVEGGIATYTFDSNDVFELVEKTALEDEFDEIAIYSNIEVTAGGNIGGGSLTEPQKQWIGEGKTLINGATSLPEGINMNTEELTKKAPINHNHDYAPSDHNHNELYAPCEHTHTDLLKKPDTDGTAGQVLTITEAGLQWKTPSSTGGGESIPGSGLTEEQKAFLGASGDLQTEAKDSLPKAINEVSNKVESLGQEIVNIVGGTINSGVDITATEAIDIDNIAYSSDAASPGFWTNKSTNIHAGVIKKIKIYSSAPSISGYNSFNLHIVSATDDKLISTTKIDISDETAGIKNINCNINIPSNCYPVIETLNSRAIITYAIISGKKMYALKLSGDIFSVSSTLNGYFINCGVEIEYISQGGGTTTIPPMFLTKEVADTLYLQRGIADIDEIVHATPIHGQSLSIGVQWSVPPINVYSLDSAEMLNQKVNISPIYYSGAKQRYPLKEVDCETSASSTIAMFKTLLNSKYNIKNVINGFGVGGASIDEIDGYESQESSDYNTVFYSLKSWITSIPLTYPNVNCIVPAIFWIQGEADADTKKTKVWYKDKLKKLRSDIDAHAKSTTSQIDDVKLITYQLQYHPNNYFDISLAHLECCLEDDNIVMSTPIYILDYVSDEHNNVHITAKDQTVLGAYQGVAYYKSCILKENIKPIHAISSEINGNNILIKFAVPNPPLRMSTDIVSSINNAGFELIKDGVDIISSISLLGSDAIVIKCNIDPSGGELRYAMQTANNLMGNQVGNRGNICDSAGDFYRVNIDGAVYRLDNYLPIFKMTV